MHHNIQTILKQVNDVYPEAVRKQAHYIPTYKKLVTHNPRVDDTILSSEVILSKAIYVEDGDDEPVVVRRRMPDECTIMYIEVYSSHKDALKMYMRLCDESGISPETSIGYVA